jgi:1-deoxy-D-xylulose-5-phosphate reductoisomerase
MGLPIALGLAWPDRLADVAAACDFSAPTNWTFEPVDHDAFPALGLARRAGTAGGLVPATYNASNEVAVRAFRDGLLTFPGISQVLAGIIEQAEQTDLLIRDPETVGEVLAAESWARRRAGELVTERAGAAR